VKVTGSITVSTEPSNEDGGDGDGGVAKDNDGGNVPVDVFLARCMKSLVNDAVKKHIRDKCTTLEEEEDNDDDLSSPMPQRHNATSLLMQMQMMMMMMMVIETLLVRRKRKKMRSVICLMSRLTMSMRKTINSPRRWTR
jgi:hypothetical protein